MDETLLHSSENRDLYHVEVKRYQNDFDTLTRIRNLNVRLVSREGRIQNYYMWTILRPGWDTMLREAQKHFQYIGIYSAGQREYVEACAEIFSEVVNLDFVLSANDLINRTKPLSIVRSILPETVTMENIVLIDDLSENFIENPHNGHQIIPYSPITPCTSDNCLHQLVDRFSRLQFESPQKALHHELPREFS